jgi:hypothetical protein
MLKHKGVVRSMALSNADVTRDMFFLPHDVWNLSNKMAEDLWQKREKDAVSARRTLYGCFTTRIMDY